jgi:ABC-2 type transport system permease protein
MTYWLTLIRREFWEHRSLWVAPLATAGVLIAVMAMVGGLNMPGTARIQIDGAELDFLRDVTPARATRNFGVTLMVLCGLQALIGMIVIAFYLLDTMYTERKDRSILFWKSLPVSDVHTVASKALVALLVVPLGVYLLTVVSSLLAFAALKWNLSNTPYDALVQWDGPTWIAVQLAMLVATLTASLWYAPIAAALLLISAWARRNVMLWAILPALGLVLLEEVALDSHHVGNFIAYRFSGLFGAADASAASVATDAATSLETELTHASTVYTKLDVAPLLANPDLWLGVVAALVMLWLAAEIRRRRDET